MMYSIKNREQLEKVNELDSLQNQVNEVWLQDRLGKQIFHENVKDLCEPLTDTIKDMRYNKNYNRNFYYKKHSIR